MKKSILLIGLLTFGVSSAQASFIYGLAKQGGIFKINTATGVSTKVANTRINNNRGGTNGFAYDGVSNFYYYEGSKLYKNNGTESLFATTGFTGANDNAAFYNGKYYFVSAANKLKNVNLTTGVTSAAVTVNGVKDDYGDIAIDRFGKVWSQEAGNTQTFDLNNLGAGATTLAGSKGQLQLGFDAVGALFGINYDDGKIYKINTATGARTFTGGIAKYNNTLLNINDAASAAYQPVPEPASMVALGMAALALLRRKKKSA